jgi:hypothetical protein
MEDGKQEDLEQQVNEMVRRSMSSWYSLWGNEGNWSLTSATEPVEMVLHHPASTVDHTVLVVETDPSSSSEEAGRG